MMQIFWIRIECGNFPELGPRNHEYARWDEKLYSRIRGAFMRQEQNVSQCRYAYSNKDWTGMGIPMRTKYERLYQDSGFTTCSRGHIIT